MSRRVYLHPDFPNILAITYLGRLYCRKNLHTLRYFASHKIAISKKCVILITMNSLAIGIIIAVPELYDASFGSVP